jgi:hypothetical protein
MIQCQSNDDGCPKFEPLAMLGGVVWACGNVWVVPIVKTIGLSMGLLIWGMVNMLRGWASGRFGLFGLTPDAIGSPAINDAGVFFAVAALGVYVFLKPEMEEKGKGAGAEGDEEHDAAYAGLYKESELGYAAHKPLVGAVNDGDEGDATAAGGEEEETSWTDRLNPKQKFIFGVAASVVSGILYGVNFDPPSYVVRAPRCRAARPP